MAPAIMGNTDRPELSLELTNTCCRTDPDMAKEFARVHLENAAATVVFNSRHSAWQKQEAVGTATKRLMSVIEVLPGGCRITHFVARRRSGLALL